MKPRHVHIIIAFAFAALLGALSKSAELYLAALTGYGLGWLFTIDRREHW